MATLIVPIRLDILQSTEGMSICSNDFVFENLPWFDPDKNFYSNSDNIFIGETIETRPFADENKHLSPGQHLHFSLPDFLCKSKFGAAPTDFPPVPNRWYIKREPIDGSNVETKEWIVESDYIWLDKAPASTISIPNDFIHSTIISQNEFRQRKPYNFMGRCVPYSSWLGESDYQKSTNVYYSKMYGPFTSLGWGSPYFDSFFPNCQSVFGMLDDDVINAKCKYTVIGWYSNNTDDYGVFLSGNVKAGKITSNDLLKYYKLDIPNTDEISNTVFLGSFNFDPTNKETFNNDENYTISLAPTPEEALSSLLASMVTSNTKEKELLEDQLESIIMGDQLHGTKIDIGHTFKELRHAKGFLPVDATTIWTIKFQPIESNASINKNEQVDGNTNPDMPSVWHDLLNSLNDAQSIYDSNLLLFNDLKDALYADWYRYILSCYSPAKEIDQYPDPTRLMDFIKTDLLNKCSIQSRSMGYLGKPPFEIQPHDYTYSGAIKRAFNTLNVLIQNENTKNKVNGKWILAQTVGPRFWAPTPPSIVIASINNNKKLKYSPRFNQTDSIKCTFIREDKIDFFKSNSISSLISQLPPDFGLNDNNLHDVWHPFRMEWEVEYFKIKNTNTELEQKFYQSDFFTDKYSLNENEAEFSLNYDNLTNNDLERSFSAYRGASILTSKLTREFASKIEFALNKLEIDNPLVEKLNKIVSIFNEHNILSFTLGGLNDAFLQKSSFFRMRPFDPFGTYDYQLFTLEVSQIIRAQDGKSPNPFLDFNPIRAGALYLNEFRLVDTFGRVTTINPTKVITTTKMAIEGQERWVELYPRFSQPIRANFRFVSCNDESNLSQSNSHPESNPIVGWIVPNLIERSLMFFDKNGKRLGEIDVLGKWEHELEPSGFIKQVIDWIIQKPESSYQGLENFIRAFIEDLEDALDNIHPEDKIGASALSIFIGRPMAIVKASLDLQLMGSVAHDLSWNAIHQDLSTNQRQTYAYTSVQVPYRLGEYKQLNDGLIGFWNISDGNINESKFTVCDSITGSFSINFESQFYSLPKELINKIKATKDNKPFIPNDYSGKSVKKHEFISNYLVDGSLIWSSLVSLNLIIEEAKFDRIVHYADVKEKTICLEDRPRNFLLLLDPYGEVTLNTGVLPTKAIKLPNYFFEDTLKKIEIQFLTPSILTPRNSLQIPLPKIQGYHWNWVQFTKSKTSNERTISRTWHEPFIIKNRINTEYEKSGLIFKSIIDKDLFTYLLKNKWLISLIAEENPDVGVPDYPKIKNEYASKDFDTEQYKNLMTIIQNSLETDAIIHNVQNRAIFNHGLESRDGWLSLLHDLNN